VSVDTAEEVATEEPLGRYAFGAQFVEARVDASTGEVRVPRMVGKGLGEIGIVGAAAAVVGDHGEPADSDGQVDHCSYRKHRCASAVR
jgi:CO/xanthine dehydrogenase Mo-binding subunit